MFGLIGAVAGLLAEQPGVDVVLQNDTTNGLIIGGVGFVAGLAVIAGGVQQYRKGRLVADTATETPRSAAVGQTELEGTARPLDEPSRQPFDDGPCLYAEWRVEEFRPFENDSDTWETIGKGSYAPPFRLTDDDGAVVVDPDADTAWRLTDRCTTQWTFAGDVDPTAEAEAFSPSEAFSTETSNRRRYTQTVLPPGTSAYVFGQAVPTDEGELPEYDLKIERDTASDRFIISNNDEESLRSSYNRWAPLYVLAGLVVCAASLYLGLWMAG